MFFKSKVKDFVKNGYNGLGSITQGFANVRAVSYETPKDNFNTADDVVKWLKKSFSNRELMQNLWKSTQGDRLTIFSSAEFAFGWNHVSSFFDEPANWKVSGFKTVPPSWKPDIMNALREIAADLEKETAEKVIICLTANFEVHQDGKNVPIVSADGIQRYLAENVCIIATGDGVSTISKSTASLIDDMGDYVIEPPKDADGKPFRPGTKPYTAPVKINIRENDGSITELNVTISICLDITKDVIASGLDAINKIKPDIEVVPAAACSGITDWKSEAKYVFVFDYNRPDFAGGYELGEQNQRQEITSIAKLAAVRTGLEYVSIALSEAGIFDVIELPDTGKAASKPLTANDRPVTSRKDQNREFYAGPCRWIEYSTFKVDNDMTQQSADHGLTKLVSGGGEGNVGGSGRIEDPHGNDPVIGGPEQKPDLDPARRDPRGKI